MKIKTLDGFINTQATPSEHRMGRGGFVEGSGGGVREPRGEGEWCLRDREVMGVGVVTS